MSTFASTYIGKYAVALSSNNKNSSSTIKGFLSRRIHLPMRSYTDTHLQKKLKTALVLSSTQELINLSNGSNNNLFHAKTIFPFVFFADTLRIDRQKLTVVHNGFLKSSHTTSVRLKDLRNVEVVLGPLFGSIILTSQHFLNNTQTLNYLKRRDAICAQRLLQGFMVAHDANINTDDIEENKLLRLLDKIGKENLR